MFWFLFACAAVPGDTATLDDTAAPDLFYPGRPGCADALSALEGEVPPSVNAREDATVNVAVQLLGWGEVCDGGCPAGAAWEVAGPADPVWSIRVDPSADSGWCWIESGSQRFQVWIENAE